jgi:hypothetical protein
MTKLTLLKRISLLFVLGGALAVTSGTTIVSGQSSANPCGMQLNQAPVIFCDTFSVAHPVTNRSGQLDGVVWGVSRLGGRGIEWHDSTIDGCNGPRPASAINATDVIVCNGQLRQSYHDNHDVTVMAMYPKQPFDWANRTGTVSFDVSNDTTGTHGAWPEFWITDLPIPAPNAHLIPCDTCSFGRHSFGIRFAADRGSCQNGWRADSVVIVRNSVVEDRSIFENNTTGAQIRERGCATLSSGPNGGLNHVEIRISQNTIDVYASDAGSRTLKLINSITNANLSFTRGLIWIGDYRYNAEKAHTQDPSVPDQTNHTYTWDNVAFDGPATYRDLSFDVLDRANSPVGGGVHRIGWETTPVAPANLTTLPMTTQNISAATHAYLLFNFGPFTTPGTFTYTINGRTNTAPNPQPSTGLKGWRAMALPVPLNQLVGGAQNIRLSGDVSMNVQNVNIVLVAAAPVPGGTVPSPPANLRIITQ